MVRQIAHLDRGIAQADPRADDRVLTIILEAAIEQAQFSGWDKPDGAAHEVAADVLVDQRRLADIAGAPLRSCGWRIAPGDMDMGLGVPQLVLGRLIAMPAEPPVDHGRGYTGHRGPNADPHAAVGRQDKAVLKAASVPEQRLRRPIQAWHQDVRHAAAIECGTDMRCQGREVRPEEARKGQGQICRPIAQIPTLDRLAALHAGLPI